ncbi:MAG: tRNA lysidine(34) synthetase TilS [Phyllobacteriaceae bacterium]|nr:tRNA lysidine(34) synthetase TilS [Phyllobacteriaceae bacterium]
MTAAIATYSDHLFEGISTEAPVIVAVSGGSDSMALLQFAHVWAQKHGADLHAVTIDHGLRPEAAAEAAFVAGVCAGMGVPHLTLAWDGAKPAFGIQEAARLSRYTLLDDFAQDIGAVTVLTGHTRDDQAETIFMRAVRSAENGAGDGRGLAAMARVTTMMSGTSIVRPLLEFSRQSLRAMLTDLGQAWIEDPSNFDETYERVRVRRMLEKDMELSGRLLRLGNLSARLRRCQAEDAARYLKEHAAVEPGPVFRLALPAGGKVMNHPVIELAIQVMIAVAGGQSHLVPRRRLVPVREMIAGFRAIRPGGKDPSVTLGGAVIGCRAQAEKGAKPRRSASHLVFMRERRNLGSLLLEPGEAALWDGRLHITNGTSATIFIEPAGRQQIAEYEAARGGRYKVSLRRALFSTPVVHTQETDHALPRLPMVESGNLPRGLEVRLAPVAIEHFCPDTDIALKDWVRSLDSHASASLQP